MGLLRPRQNFRTCRHLITHENAWGSINVDQSVFANGIAIRNGSYGILMGALRMTGDPTQEEDHSPIFGINAA